MARGLPTPAKSCGNPAAHGIFAGDSATRLIQRHCNRCFVHDIAFDGPAHRPRHAQGPALAHGPDHGRRRRIAAGAIALVAYLLWPTWGDAVADAPARLPVSVGATLFNVPTTAIRMKIQRHSGPQERVDLSFTLPFARSARGAEARQRRYGRGEGAADRPDLPVDRGPSRHAGARHARPHDLSALSRADLNAGRRRIDDARVSRRHALWQ